MPVWACLPSQREARYSLLRSVHYRRIILSTITAVLIQDGSKHIQGYSFLHLQQQSPACLASSPQDNLNSPSTQYCHYSHCLIDHQLNKKDGRQHCARLYAAKSIRTHSVNSTWNNANNDVYLAFGRNCSNNTQGSYATNLQPIQRTSLAAISIHIPKIRSPIACQRRAPEGTNEDVQHRGCKNGQSWLLHHVPQFISKADGCSTLL
jgi:hypothetical protein